jgi:hypothetical protein
MAPGDVYNPDGYDKHKEPNGWGSLCPATINLATAQQLLDSGVRVGDVVFNVDGEFAYRAFEHSPQRFHGHPIPWSQLPAAAWRALIAAGRLTAKDYRKAIRSSLGAQFS